MAVIKFYFSCAGVRKTDNFCSLSASLCLMCFGWILSQSLFVGFVIEYWSVLMSVICSLSCNNLHHRRCHGMIITFWLEIRPRENHYFILTELPNLRFLKKTLRKKKSISAVTSFLFWLSVVWLLYVLFYLHEPAALWKHLCKTFPFFTCENTIL